MTSRCPSGLSQAQPSLPSQRCPPKPPPSPRSWLSHSQGPQRAQKWLRCLPRRPRMQARRPLIKQGPRRVSSQHRSHLASWHPVPSQLHSRLASSHHQHRMSAPWQAARRPLCRQASPQTCRIQVLPWSPRLPRWGQASRACGSTGCACAPCTTTAPTASRSASSDGMQSRRPADQLVLGTFQMGPCVGAQQVF